MESGSELTIGWPTFGGPIYTARGALCVFPLLAAIGWATLTGAVWNECAEASCQSQAALEERLNGNESYPAACAQRASLDQHPPPAAPDRN